MTDYELNHTGTGGEATFCEVSSSNKVIIKKMAKKSTGTQFTFRVLATFSGTTTNVSNAQTMIDGGELIDRSTSLSFARSATTIEAVMDQTKTSIALDNVDDAAGHVGALYAGAKGADASLVALQIAQTLNSNVAAPVGSVVTISFPFTNSEAGLDTWYFGTTDSTPIVSEIDTISDDVFDACGNATNE